MMNQRLKKVSVIVVIALLLQLLSVLTCFAAIDAGNITIRLEADKTDLIYGDEFNLNVYIESETMPIPHGGICIIGINVKFDNVHFEPVMVNGSYAQAGSIVTSKGSLGSQYPGTSSVNIVYGAQTTPAITQQGLFCTIRFRVRDNVTAGIFKFETYNASASADLNLETTTRPRFTVAVEKGETRIKNRFTVSADSIVEQGGQLRIYGMSEVSPLRLRMLDSVSKEVFTVNATSGADGSYEYLYNVPRDMAAGSYRVYAIYGAITDSTGVIIKVPGTLVVANTEGNKGDETKTETEKGTSGSYAFISDPTYVEKNNDTEQPDEGNNTEEVDEIPLVPAPYPGDIVGHWAEESIKYVYDNGLMNGYEDGTFLPEDKVTRAEFSTVMYRLMKLRGTNGKVFDDTAGHWAKNYVAALADLGVVGGVSASMFEPDESITREQLAAILDRAFKPQTALVKSKFMDDENISDWAYEHVYHALAAGWMSGNEGQFMPLNNATRAEIATILMRGHSSGSFAVK